LNGNILDTNVKPLAHKAKGYEIGFAHVKKNGVQNPFLIRKENTGNNKNNSRHPYQSPPEFLQVIEE
jgi:hypothetical protein